MDFDKQVAFIQAMSRESVQYVALDDLASSEAITIAVCDSTLNMPALERALSSMPVDVAREIRTVPIEASRWNELSSLRAPRGVRKFRSFDALVADRERLHQERIARLRGDAH